MNSKNNLSVDRKIQPFLGFLWGLIGLFVLLAFVDYDPNHSSFHTTKAEDYWRSSGNRLGYVGVWLTFYSHRFLGYSAILCPIYFLWLGGLYLFGYGNKFSVKKALYFLLSLFCLSNLGVFLEKTQMLSVDYGIYSAGAGGVLGLYSFRCLFEKYLGPLGSGLILFPSSFLFILLAFASPTRLVSWLTKGSRESWKSGTKSLASIFQHACGCMRRMLCGLISWAKALSWKRKKPQTKDENLTLEEDFRPIKSNENTFVDLTTPAEKKPLPKTSTEQSGSFFTLENKPNKSNAEPIQPKKPSSKSTIQLLESETVERAVEHMPTKEGNYLFPPVELLQEPPPVLNTAQAEDYYETAQDLVKKLAEFGVEVKVEAIQSGPVITRYEVTPARGVRVEKITNLEKNIALGLKALSVRIQAPVPGKGCVGIEIPNKAPLPVCLREILESKAWANSNAEIPIVLGKEVTGKPMVADLTKMPHLLIAGSTGSGKTVCINTVIASLLYHASPEDLRFIMVDPKIVEMKIYNDLPHMLIPVVTEPKRVPAALKWLIGEMERRYQIFAEHGARNIASFNIKACKLGAQSELSDEKNPFIKGSPKKLPYIVCIIDELADLMMVAPGDIETSIARLAQLARAAGIHLIIATQRPSVNVITGIIKANLPSRIAFKVASKVDSRTILDAGGADSLIGKGDMLFVPPGASQLIRAQGALVSDEEINAIVEFLKRNGPPDFAEEVQRIVDSDEDESIPALGPDEPEDALIPQALEVLKTSDRISTSLLQRRLKIGYNRAARIMEALEAKGLVPRDGEL